MDVLVLGCGVVGLTSAVLLQEAGYSTQVWALLLPPHTTSDKGTVLCTALPLSAV
jgi:D-amino-acid oxidase